MAEIEKEGGNALIHLNVPADLRAWQAHMGYTYDTAAAALGMSRSAYAAMLANPDRQIDRRTALACAALAVGLGEWRVK